MPASESEGQNETEGPDDLAKLRVALQAAERTIDTERRNSGRWEREAVLRASTVASQLAQDILAARRLANAVERHLDLRDTVSDPGATAIRQALHMYREICGD
jgi:hypothetical protein